MGKTKTVLLTLGITFLVLFLLSLIAQVGNNHTELKELECSIECASFGNNIYYEYTIQKEFCSCYDENNTLIASGEL